MPNFPQMPKDTHPFSDQNNTHNEEMIVSCTHTQVLLTSKLLCMTLLLNASPTYKSWRNLTALLCIRLTDKGLLLQRAVKQNKKHKTKRLEQLKRLFCMSSLKFSKKLLWRVDLKIFINNHKLCSGRLQSVRYFIMNVNIFR